MNNQKKSPWGNLVGIRPVKRVVQMMDDGLNDDAIKSILKQDFHVSDEKSELAIKIAGVERNLMKTVAKNAVSLYIDIPFCPSKCIYCSFASMPVSEMRDFIEPYLNALYLELDKIATVTADLDMEIVSIYIGGGTPTSILSIELDNLLYKITKTFDLTHLREFTIEAGRPDTITESKLEVMRKYGVDRISINPQSMNDKTLQVIGRRHTVSQIYDTFDLAKKYSFKCINMDVIAGLPQESVSDFTHTIDAVIAMEPANITVHTMSIKRAAKLNRDRNFAGLPENSAVAEMVSYAHKQLRNFGYDPYYLYRQKNILGNLENTGFCRGATPGIYNICMMEETNSVFSAGVGAVTKLVRGSRIERIFNVKDVREYLKRAEEMRERKNYIYEFFKQEVY